MSPLPWGNSLHRSPEEEGWWGGAGRKGCHLQLFTRSQHDSWRVRNSSSTQGRRLIVLTREAWCDLRARVHEVCKSSLMATLYILRCCQPSQFWFHIRKKGLIWQFVEKFLFIVFHVYVWLHAHICIHTEARHQVSSPTALHCAFGARVSDWAWSSAILQS